MNTKTNTLWCRGLAMLALTFALAGTALGQITIQWSNPADITYGTPLDGTQLNARAVDATGADVPGTFKYSWDAPAPPANAGVGEDDPATDGVKIGTRELTLADILKGDADSNGDNGIQVPDWRYLDVGNNQTLRVTFDPRDLVQLFPATVSINVKRKAVSVFPQTLSRNYGEENYTGWETGKTPTYPGGGNLFDRGGAGIVGVGPDNFLLNSAGVRVSRNGADVNITAVAHNEATGYSMTGEGLSFDGFVRGETYTKLASDHADIASAGEDLVTTLPQLSVKDGSGNDIFRAAPVGTTGNVTFAQVPVFKNYSVSIGASGSLTVKKASISFKGATIKDGAAKTYGNALVLDETNAFDNPDLSINNDFRLGEQEIKNFITISSGGTGATANAGTYSIDLTETPPATFDVSILRDNYNFSLTSGSLQVKQREISFKGVPSAPPSGFDPTNTSGFNFKLYGDSAQPPTVTVTGLAPHHIKDGAAEYSDPLNPGAVANTYLISNIKSEALAALPVSSHAAGLQSVPGFYSVPVSGGDGGVNYKITGRNSGSFEVRRAYLVIQVGNASSIVNGSQQTAPLSLFGVRTFDQVLDGAGNLDVDATLSSILVAGTPKPATAATGFNANPAGPFPVTFPIEFTNKKNVRAKNYDVYFNDGGGSSNFLDNGTRVAIDNDGNIAAGQKGFNNFLANVFNSGKDLGGFNALGTGLPASPGGTQKDADGNLLSHALFVVNDSTIGKYSVDVIRPSVSWNPPASVAYGTDTKDSDLNAVILNPDTGLELDDNRNVPQLIKGVDYNLVYSITPDGGAASIIKGAGAVANPFEIQRTLKAGKTHKLSVAMSLTAAGQVKVANENRNDDQFTAATTTKNLAVFARNLTVTPREAGKDKGKADLIFGNAIPSQNLTDAFWDVTIEGTGNLTEAQVAAEINQADAKVAVIDSSGATVAAGTTTASRGNYVTRLSGLKATNGNVAFTTSDGSLTITPIPVVIEWENNLPTITYGEKIPTAGVKDAVIKTSGVGAGDGQIVYTPDPGASDIYPDFPSKEIKAKWVPNDAATSNYGESNEITRNVGVNRKAITVAVNAIDKTFGDDTPARTLVTPIAGLLAQQDAGKVTVDFDVDRNGADKKANVDTYNITPRFTDSSNRLANYAVTIQNSRIKVNKRDVSATPVSRTMEVGLNATDFVDNWDVPGSTVKANAIITFVNLASFHDIGDDRGKLNAAFPDLELGTDSPSLPPVGQTAKINIDNLGFRGGTVVDGARFDTSNYNFTSNNGVATLTVVEKKLVINWADVAITYGQKIGRSGKNPGDNGGTKLNDIKALNASSPQSLDGDIVYTFVKAVNITRPTAQSFAAGDVVPDGVILPAGSYKVKAAATPAAGETNFAANSVEKTITVAKRPLTITINDRSNAYGGIDLKFDAVYGVKDGDGKFSTDNQLVNGDTADTLDRQLVLFSNADANSGAGDYFIAVGQSAADANYAINPVGGSQDLFDGIVKDGNGVVLVNVGTNFVPDGGAGTGAAFGFTTSAGGVSESNAGKLTVTKTPLTIAAADQTKDSGQANPVLTAITPDASQLKNGDTLDSLLSTPVRFSTSVGATTGPGSYDIFAFGGSAANYVVTHQNGTFTVLAPAADISWSPNPGSIVYGTALGAEQLNASSSVAGTFDYSDNAAGTVLAAGTHELKVTFTPTDLNANRVTTAMASVEVTKAPLTVTANSVTRAYSEANPAFTVAFDGFVNGDGPLVVTSAITYTTDGIAGANAGSYPLTPGGGAAANYELAFVDGTVTITKEAATVTLSDLTQAADGTPRAVTVTTDPAGVNVKVTYNGSADAPTTAGTYGIRVLADDPNYTGFAVGTLNVSGEATVSFDGLAKVFNGAGQGASVSTEPAGLAVDVTYNGSADLPVDAGTYEVRAIIDDLVFAGFGVAVLEIGPATATVSFDLDSLSQPINALTGATATTDPAGLNVEIFYGDVTSLPSKIGSVLARAVVNEPNWVGSVTSTFKVTEATQEVTPFPLPAFTMAGAPLNVGLVATASSGLPVTFAVSSGDATVSGNLLTVTQPGDIVVVASQAGDDFYAPAEATFTVSVGGQGVPKAAPVLTVVGVSGGNIELSISGSAGATVSVMSSDTLAGGGSFSDAGTVTLDGSGNGSISLPAGGGSGYFKAANQ